MPTILITGRSSSSGPETTRLFLDRGRNVVATMRALDGNALPLPKRLRTLRHHVTDPTRVAGAVEEAGLAETGAGSANAISIDAEG